MFYLHEVNKNLRERERERVLHWIYLGHNILFLVLHSGVSKNVWKLDWLGLLMEKYTPRVNFQLFRRIIQNRILFFNTLIGLMNHKIINCVVKNIGSRCLVSCLYFLALGTK